MLTCCSANTHTLTHKWHVNAYPFDGVQTIKHVPTKQYRTDGTTHRINDQHYICSSQPRKLNLLDSILFYPLVEIVVFSGRIITKPLKTMTVCVGIVGTLQRSEKWTNENAITHSVASRLLALNIRLEHACVAWQNKCCKCVSSDRFTIHCESKWKTRIILMFLMP